MKVSKFFKILNYKIEKYDKMATNPFTEPHNFILVWVEENNSIEEISVKESDT